MSEETEETSAETSPNAEAAKYRLRLRETETERDNLLGQLESMTARIDAAQKHVADSILSETVKADDFWLLGDTLDSFRDDAGDLDPEALRERAKEVVQERPNFAAKRFSGTADQGTRGSAPVEKPTFASLFSK